MALPTIILNGRAVDDLELRFTSSGKAVASVRVAASERRKNPSTQEYEDGERIFLNVSLWEKDAEAAADAGITKGTPVLVTGSLFEREYDRSDGMKGKSLEVKYATVAKVPPRVQSGQPSGGQVPPTPQPWGAPTPAADPWAQVGNDARPPF